MHKIQVWAEVSDAHYRAYEDEAKRRAVTVEELVQQTVNCLLHELEQKDEDCTGLDEYISAS